MRAASSAKHLERHAQEHRDVVISTEQEGSPMPGNEFRQPVSVDSAPRGSVCEWCGQPAVLEVTVASGVYDEEPAYFCRLCGEEFARAVADSLDRTITEGVDTHA
jgi:hypothetical protein